jgi:hypothetical protein
MVILLVLLAIRFIQIHRYILRPYSRIGHFTVRPEIIKADSDSDPRQSIKSKIQQNPNPNLFLFFIPIEADLTVSIIIIKKKQIPQNQTLEGKMIVFIILIKQAIKREINQRLTTTIMLVKLGFEEMGWGVR